MRAALRGFALIVVAAFLWPSLAPAQPAQPVPPPNQLPPQGFTPGELVNAGHRFFGTVSQGLASVIEKAVSQWGLPNGYVLGEEAGGAFFGGLRYGEGMALYEERRRPQSVLAGAVNRMGFRRRWRTDNDARVQTSVSQASAARPILLAALG
jgi:hypothetical protein